MVNGERHRYEWGCVHGRFQPFHTEHLEYALRARKRCRRLIVGITNPDPTWVKHEAWSKHRHAAGSNPFTYVERALMVEGSLLDEGFEARDFLVVPFPIQDPGLCRFYVPEHAVHFVRVYSGWEEEKARRLRTQGFTVEVLDRGKEKGISGSEVRGLLQAGLEWEHLVPKASARVIQDALTEDPRRLHAYARGSK
ncbi:MAG: nicotinate-nucleotide adenylyltransferase [Actinomycetota bacterium]|jgi:nicotinamide mononucleotide adenylyltransferase|nr:nicotinate-nucleotide adenylyltransferase [Actinomycetota bacterium]